MIVLKAGDRLAPGQEVRAEGMLLAFQGDGNLVLYRRDGTPVWATDTFGTPSEVAMQGDGNLVVYHAGGPVWASDTFRAGGVLELTREGLKITAQAVVWQTPAFDGGGDPTPEPPRLFGPNRIIGQRAVGDDRGPQLYVGLSRFYHVWAAGAEPGRVEREDEQDALAGMDFKRVLLQVGSLDPSDYWAGRVADQNSPTHERDVVTVLESARAHGIRMLAAIIGKGNGMDRQDRRRPYVRRMAQILRDYPDVVLLAQVMNEPYAEGRVTPNELLELEDIIMAEAPNLITSTGAHGFEDQGGGFDRRAWGRVGSPHLDRDKTKSEMQDRPWRQPWDWGLQGAAWVNDEPIGPGASVATEERPLVLRSHATVTFMAGGYAYCYHCDGGIRGNSDATQAPGYRDVVNAKRFLPGNLPNGAPQNANPNFPNRHWTLEDYYIRASNGNGRGIVRAYGVQVDGVQWTTPFGPVTDYELRATRALEVECFQQDVNDRLWVGQVGAGERVRFSAQHPDYILKSRAL